VEFRVHLVIIQGTFSEHSGNMLFGMPAGTPLGIPPGMLGGGVQSGSVANVVLKVQRMPKIGYKLCKLHVSVPVADMVRTVRTE
jgi:hypothetical protein